MLSYALVPTNESFLFWLIKGLLNFANLVVVAGSVKKGADTIVGLGDRILSLRSIETGIRICKTGTSNLEPEYYKKCHKGILHTVFYFCLFPKDTK